MPSDFMKRPVSYSLRTVFSTTPLSTSCLTFIAPSDISITSHSSTLRAMLDVLDHPHKKFESAEVIPLVVKAVRKQRTEQ
jgi:hypothetical protein